MAAAIRSLLFDESERQSHAAVAERYVHDFCAVFGQDAARNVAAEVKRRTRPLASPASDNETTIRFGETDV